MRSLALLSLVSSLSYGATQVQSSSQIVFTMTNDLTRAITEAKSSGITIVDSFPVYRLDKAALTSSFGIDGKAVLFHTKKNFFVHDGKTVHSILAQNVDSEIRSVTITQLASLLEQGKLEVSRRPTGDYVLKYSTLLKGGGVIGANIGFFTGKGLVHLIGHGLIGLASIGAGIAGTLTGGPIAGVWAAGTAVKTLEGMFAIPIEAASNVVGLGGGIMLGTATGPA